MAGISLRWEYKWTQKRMARVPLGGSAGGGEELLGEELSRHAGQDYAETSAVWAESMIRLNSAAMLPSIRFK
jgi:hypothetical protein